MHYQILNRGYISLHFSFINPVFLLNPFTNILSIRY